jgi:hypothetical protein
VDLYHGRKETFIEKAKDEKESVLSNLSLVTLFELKHFIDVSCF